MVEEYDNMQSYQLKRNVIKDDQLYVGLLSRSLSIRYSCDDIIDEKLTTFWGLNGQELHLRMMSYLL
jgi:hypothetical protein